MSSLKAAGGSPAKRCRHAAPSPTDQDEGIGIRDGITETAFRSVSVSQVPRRHVRDLFVTFAGLALFLGVLALTSLVAGLLYGLGGLALGVGIFVVALMVMAREEGL